MDKTNRLKIIGLVLSSGLVVSSAGYAQDNVNATTSTTQNKTAVTDQTDALGNDQTTSSAYGENEVKVDDQTLKAQAAAALEKYSDKVKIAVKNGVIHLSGKLDSDTDYENVVALAESIKGVQNVETDELTVKDSDRPLKDIYITAKVKGALIRADLFDTDIPSWSIGVETKNGTVFLSGEVASEADKQKIVQIAHSIEGVEGVEDKMVVSKDVNDGSDSESNGNTNANAVDTNDEETAANADDANVDVE